MAERTKEQKPGKVCSMTFEPAENGLVSHMATRFDRGGQGGGPEYDHESKTTIHKSMAHAVKHLKEHMGGQFEREEAAEGEKEA